MEQAMITGMGVVTPVGNDINEFSNALRSGVSGIRSISRDGSPFFSGGISSITSQGWIEYFNISEDMFLPMTTQFALSAVTSALKHANLDKARLAEKKAAVILGGSTSVPEIAQVYETAYGATFGGEIKIPKNFFGYQCGFNAAAEIASILEIRGTVRTISNACASGTAAIGIGAELIKNGRADVVIAGGTDSGININTMGLFSVLNVLSKDSDVKHSCRPFSKNRTGCVIGEGAGIVILESVSSAQKRGIAPLAEVLGYASVTDTSHVTSPDMNGRIYMETMSRALANSGCNVDDVDYINAHGTGTYYNDLIETVAIKSLFGSRAYNIPVSSIKALIGHLLSAAGAVECIASVEALKDGILPPTCCLTENDIECDLDYISESARKKNVKTVLSNSFGFGGQNSALVLRRCSTG